MSEFDELFKTFSDSTLSVLLKDSKVVIVNEGDVDHPLKLGEFWYEQSDNTLFVGCGSLGEKLNILHFIKHTTGISVKRAPRLKTSFLFELPLLSYDTSAVKKQTTRITSHYEFIIPSITHESEVNYVES